MSEFPTPLSVCYFAGELQEYVVGELNVVELATCDDVLRYAELVAEPEWGVLGKKLGKDMGKVCGWHWCGAKGVGLAARIVLKCMGVLQCMWSGAFWGEVGLSKDIGTVCFSAEGLLVLTHAHQRCCTGFGVCLGYSACVCARWWWGRGRVCFGGGSDWARCVWALVPMGGG